MRGIKICITGRCIIFRNLHYDTKRSRVYLWEQNEGDNDYRMIDWVPYVFEPDPHGHIETVEGIPVKKVEFNSYAEYQDYQKHHKNNIYENESPKEIQFLSEWYHNIPDNSIEPPKLKAYSIDIEVHVEGKLDMNKVLKVRKKM